MNTELIETGDGSHTLFVEEINEYYHSIHGAVSESLHVYIQAGLMKHGGRHVKILEIGMGTGLNILLTLLESVKQTMNITYHSIEKFPLSPSFVTSLNYDTQVADAGDWFYQIHQSPWNTCRKLHENFTLCKFRVDWEFHELKEQYDLIYYDAFGPDKQPEMWRPELLLKAYQGLNSGGIMTTYAAKGELKRMLRGMGFKLDILPGPPGKREMIRAIKTE